MSQEINRYILNLKESLESENNMEKGRSLEIKVNNMDKKGRGINGCYLTVTGLSAESGDDGAVGRGNRVNGLISPNRPMTLEAAAGKNPVNHIGKIYSLVSFDLSKRIYENFSIKNQIKIVGRIGNDLSKPLALSFLAEEKVDGDKKREITKFINEELSHISSITEKIIEEKLSVC